MLEMNYMSLDLLAMVPIKVDHSVMKKSRGRHKRDVP